MTMPKLPLRYLQRQKEETRAARLCPRQLEQALVASSMTTRWFDYFAVLK
jgi:hypothetical protein